METLLELKNAHVHYGGLPAGKAGVTALAGVTVEIDEGEIVALMGPNGAGKSTVLKAIFGLALLGQGEVRWHGELVKPVPHEMVGRGISFVPQGRRVFHHLTVRENLEVGAVRLANKQDLPSRIEEVLELFPPLRAKLHTRSGHLSGGQQQMLAIARGLVTLPRVLLLDEPSLGLAPKVVREVFQTIAEINARHETAIMVVEHNIKSLLTIAHRAYVLDQGRVVSAGQPEVLVAAGTLERVFLGEPIDA